MRNWFTDVLADIGSLRASWGALRGGWRAACRDATQLIRHRRVLVDTPAMTPDGMQVVLRTRLRLIGDAQTDILASWLAGTQPPAVTAAANTHFAAVAAAVAGWSAAVAVERLAFRLLVVAGALIGGEEAARTALTTGVSGLAAAVLHDWRLWMGVGLALVGGAVRWIVRWRLRALFRQGMSAA